MVLVIVDLKNHQALPINYTFLTGKKDPNHIPGPERAVKLLEEAIANGFPLLPVTADSWFGSKEFIKSLRHLGCEFAGEIKSNRIVRTNSQPRSLKKKIGIWFEKLQRTRLKQTKFQKRSEKRGKSFSELILFIKDLYIPLKVIAVYKRINGTTPFAFYATTDTSMAGARLWRFSRARWAIEVLFRDLKQSLGFGSLTSGGEGGAHMAVCIPLILFTSIRLDHEIWESKKGESLGTTVKKHREEGMEKSIESMVNNQNSERLSKLRARRKNPNQKPKDFCGEKKSA